MVFREFGDTNWFDVRFVAGKEVFDDKLIRIRIQKNQTSLIFQRIFA